MVSPDYVGGWGQGEEEEGEGYWDCIRGSSCSLQGSGWGDSTHVVQQWRGIHTGTQSREGEGGKRERIICIACTHGPWPGAVAPRALEVEQP